MQGRMKAKLGKTGLFLEWYMEPSPETSKLISFNDFQSEGFKYENSPYVLLNFSVNLKRLLTIQCNFFLKKSQFIQIEAHREKKSENSMEASSSMAE